MDLEGIDDQTLRKYLLGEMNEADQQSFEERMVLEEGLVELVLAVEDELVDDYLSGDLSKEEHERFDKHFLSTEERLRKLRFGKALKSYPVQNPLLIPAVGGKLSHLRESLSEKWWSFSTPFVRWAFGVVMVMALGLGSWLIYQYVRRPQLSEGMVALEEAYPNERPTESRITEWNYAPPPPVTRGSAQVSSNYVALDRAKALMQVEANERPDAQAYHDLGRLYLAEREFEKSIEQFESSLKLNERSAQVHSDYGAARIELGKSYLLQNEGGRSLEEFAKALEHLNRAVELDSSLLEPLFNRALCREYMMLTQEADNDWRLYLDKDPSSKWADEARRKLSEHENQNKQSSRTKDDLYQGFMSAFHSGDRVKAWDAFKHSRVRLGNLVAERLVGEFLQASSQPGGGEAKLRLEALRFAGQLEFENVGDRFTLDLAHFYSSADLQKQESAKKARELVGTGQGQISKSEFKSALENYERAKAAFVEIGDGCEAGSADYWMAICRNQDVEPIQGSARFRQLVQDSERANCKWLTIRAENALANNSLILNEYSKAIHHSARSNQMAEQIQDSYGQVIALADLVRAYSSLGDHRKTFEYLHQLLQLLPATSFEPIQTCLCLARTAWTMYSEGLYDAALEYQKAALNVALQLDELRMICTSYTHLGMISAKLNAFTQAILDINKALEVAENRSEERTAALMVAYSKLHLATVNRQMGDIPRAIDSYNQCIDIYTRLNHASLLHEAHKGLVLSYVADGNIAAATEELAKAIQFYEEHRAKIREQENRNNFFDLENDIYDIAIDFEYSKRGSKERAFEYSELNRGRSLLDLIARSGSVTEGPEQPDRRAVAQPLSLVQIKERLPQKAQLIQYAVLQDKLLTWFLTNSSFDVFEQPVSSRYLNELVQNYSQLVTTPGSDVRTLSHLARELYTILMAPVEARLKRDSQVFIVADKFLNNVPFQSLISPAGKYLVEDFAIEISPSASVLIACSEAALRKGQNNRESELGIAVTDFGHSVLNDLPDLPSAAREIRDVARMYSSSASLINSQASKRELLREIGKANVIHVASHFISNESSPLRSRLLLFGERKATDAGEGRGSEESLASSEIFNLRLRSAKLAVLSACRTGMDRYYRGEGALGFAHAFIAADVPLVVASLWSVDSAATTELMVSFHRKRKSEVASSAEALRQAQLAMLEGTDSRYRHPYYWASFNLIGGYAEY